MPKIQKTEKLKMPKTKNAKIYHITASWSKKQNMQLIIRTRD